MQKFYTKKNLSQSRFLYLKNQKKTSLIESTLDTEILSFKEMLDREQFLNPQDMDFSIEENGGILGQAFAYQTSDFRSKI